MTSERKCCTQETALPGEWSPSSWKVKPIMQQPEYPPEAAEQLQRTLKQLHELPPLVHVGEVRRLQTALAEAGAGKRFILHGGDCAERFIDCNKISIENKLRIILQMSLVIIWQAKMPVVRMLRGAGQFAKPRTSNFESQPDGTKIPSFRGDNVNGFDPAERTPDPSRLLRAYFHSATTINYIRALIDGGFASLLYPHKWDLDFVKDENLRREYDSILEHLSGGLQFLSTIQGASALDSNLHSIDISTSHEGLILAYEEALTEKVDDKFYNLGAHFLWIGDRTRELDGAHIEYFRGISNPIGLKCGPSLKAEELEKLVKALNPNLEEGKLVLITRYGKDKIATVLPQHIEAVKRSRVPVTWVSDAMHGNTFSAPNGIKTRNFDHVWSEIEQAFAIHQSHNTILGGVHLEMTGENVTECIGGSQSLNFDELSHAYESFCDPRLNYTQSLDVAFRVASSLKAVKNSTYKGTQL